MGGLLIREARPDEAEALSELAMRSKAYWGYDEAFMEACREELTVSPDELAARRTLVAEDDAPDPAAQDGAAQDEAAQDGAGNEGRLLGLVTLDGSPPEGAIGMMFVDPTAIGRGVGRALFSRQIARAQAEGFTLLTIDADPNAEPFYLAMGANRIGSTPSGSIPGRTLPLLTYAIHPPTPSPGLLENGHL